MNEFILLILVVVIISIVGFILLRKINNRVKDIATKVSFFDEKLDSENKKILTTINQQYTDVLTNIKKSEERMNKEKQVKEEELYERAIEIVKKRGICSPSHLQRTLKIGYSVAARLTDMLEENGLIEPATGATPRRYIGSETFE